MPLSELRLIKRCVEFCEISQIKAIPLNTRGIYVLLKERIGSSANCRPGYDVVYIGMAGAARAGIRGRLRSHRESKKGKWTHFSIFEVWENITEAEVEELEGLFRHIYRKDTKANRLNEQKSFKKLDRVAVKRLEELRHSSGHGNEKEFFALAKRFRAASDPRKAEKLAEKMGRLIFG